MAQDHFRIELIKLVSGERVLRLTDFPTGLALEQKLHPKQPVAQQKKFLSSVFEAALTRAARAAA